jgi:hypothetical protein
MVGKLEDGEGYEETNGKSHYPLSFRMKVSKESGLDEDERHYCVIGIPSPTRKFSLVVRIIDLGIPKGFANPL